MHNNSIDGNCSGPNWRNGPEKLNVATYMSAAGYDRVQDSVQALFCHQLSHLVHDYSYKTHYSGKYLNTYGTKGDGGVGLIPPGWTDWHGLVVRLLVVKAADQAQSVSDLTLRVQGNSIYYHYSMSNNGVEEKHGDDPELDYLPKVLLRKAMAFLQNVTSSGDDAPFFMMIGTPRYKAACNCSVHMSSCDAHVAVTILLSQRQNTPICCLRPKPLAPQTTVG
jgi:N-acetylglucosamine-6-sulfatase